MNGGDALAELLKQRRGWSLHLPKDEPMVLLMTGGLDSSVLAEVCLRECGATVYPFYIQRGATAEAYELRAAEDVVAYLQSKYGEAMHDLYTVDVEIPPRSIKRQLDPEYVSRHGHPLRNTIAALYGVQYAVLLSRHGQRVRTVALGSINEDISADGQPASFLAATVATCVSTDEWDWQIVAPYLLDGLLPDTVEVHKEDLVAWGKRYGFPFHLTRSCIGGAEQPCGTCSACKRRNNLMLEER